MRKKRKSRHTKVSQGDLTTDALLKQSEAHLTAGRYREAIEIYKQLLKREQRPPWLETLSGAYLDWAWELAAKGMYKEAAALWENRAGICDVQDELGLYLVWLVRGGRVMRAARMFTEAGEAFQQSPQGQRIATWLAGVLASGQTAIMEVLSANAPLTRHLASIAGALRAFCQGEDTTLKEHLKNIPYRSPYRDLRLILQALSIMDTDPAAMESLLEKVPPDSPFGPMATWMQAVALDGERLLEAVRAMDPEARSFVLTLKGWSEAQIKLANELLSRGKKKTPNQTLFKHLIANKELFETAEAKRFCLALLPGYLQGRALYEERFGALCPLDWARLSALAAERRDDLAEAISHWQQYVKLLEQQSPRGDEAFNAALALRHLADLWLRLNGPNPWDGKLQTYLARSLELDPDDRDSYLRLMKLAEQRDDSKAHGRWVEQAVRRFPEDPDIMMAAAAAAYRRGAFKKAAGFAKSLLKRDPINRSARNMLLSSHLGHARKQINAGKHSLAAKELDAASQFVQDDQQRGAVALTQGFLLLLTGSKEADTSLLRQAYENLGGGLVAHFRFWVEGLRLQITQHAVGKYFKQIKTRSETAATKQDILQLVDMINRYVSDGVNEVSDVLERLLKPLKAAVDLDYSEKDMQGICRTFQRAGHYGLLRAYAEVAIGHWGQRPIFMYYSIFGRTKGWADRMTSIENLEIQNALDKAIEEDDHDTIVRIEDFLGLGFGSAPMPFLPPGTPPPNLNEAIEDFIDEFGTDRFEDVMDFLEDIARKGGVPMPGHPKRRRR